jgi:hypothetical protein
MLRGLLENHDRSHEKMAVMMCLRNMGTACESFQELIFVACKSNANSDLRTRIELETIILYPIGVYPIGGKESLPRCNPAKMLKEVEVRP